MQSTYTVGGSVSGLTVPGLSLTDNGGDTLTVASGATSFTFSAPLVSGATYAVAVARQPAGEYCKVTAGSGTVSGNVGTVSVACGSNLQVLHEFYDSRGILAGGAADGAAPQSGLIADSDGNLYGTTNLGGNSNDGTVYELTPNGSGGYNESVLYSFTGGSDGLTPAGGLVVDSAGDLYGTTVAGGSAGDGTVFELAPNGSGGYTESVLHSFTGGSDGVAPTANLIADSTGDLYGTTSAGGSSSSGTVFELTPNGSGGYDESVLYAFTGGSDAQIPDAGLLADSAGDLYGTTLDGGSAGDGAVFELTPNGSGGYNESILHSFTGGSDGNLPVTDLIADSAGNLYGTTQLGGSANNGTVFELTPNGSGGYNESVLYSFTGAADGAQPEAGLVADSAGNLYGSTTAGGSAGDGTVFELTPNGSGGYHESVLYAFIGKFGATPYAGLIMDSAGNLYGTTTSGGNSNDGSVFEVLLH